MLCLNSFVLFHVVFVSQSVIEEVKRIITDSEIISQDDATWPEPDRVGRQELEIKLGQEHISFTVDNSFKKNFFVK